MTFCIGFFEESRSEARSGMSPRNQNSSEMVKYVETAKTSHTSGLLNSGQMPRTLGYGISQYAANQGRPVWISGNSSAQMPANSVIASAKRLIEVRHFCCRSSKIAEIKVPAWPMPIHQTKLMMPNAHPTGMLLPHIPIPFHRVTVIPTTSSPSPASARPNRVHQPLPGSRQTWLSSEELRDSSVCAPSMRGIGSSGSFVVEADVAVLAMSVA